MINRHTRGAGFGGVLRYITGPGEHGQVDRAQYIGSNLLAETNVRGFAREMRHTAMHNDQVEKPVFHASLRLAPGEELTNARWREVAREYMGRLGYGDAPWAVFRHTDIAEGDHIHIVASRVAVDGRLVKDSFEKQRGRAIARDLEERLHLQRTPARALERAPTLGELHRAARTETPDHRAELRSIVKTALDDSRSVGDFFSRLEAAGVRVLPNLQTTGRVAGITYSHEGKIFKGSDLGKGFTWAGLQEQGLVYNAGRDRPILEAAAARFRSTTPQHQPSLQEVWSPQALRALDNELARLRGTGPGKLERAEARQDLRSHGERAFGGAANAVRLLVAMRSPRQFAAQLIRSLPGGSLMADTLGIASAMRSPTGAALYGLRVASHFLSAASQLQSRFAQGPATDRIERRVLAAYARAAVVDQPSPGLLTERLARAGLQIENYRGQPAVRAGAYVFRTSELGLPQMDLPPRATPLPAFSFNREAAPGLAADQRTLAAASGQLRALGEPVELVIQRQAYTPPYVLSTQPQDLERLVPWLARRNAEGKDIIVRPTSDSALQVVTNRTQEQLTAGARVGYRPVAVIQTGPDRFDVWLRHGPPGTTLAPEERMHLSAAARLAFRMPPQSGEETPARLAGFTTPTGRGNERAYALLKHADAKAPARVPDLRALIRADQQHQTAVLETVLQRHAVPTLAHFRAVHGDNSDIAQAWAARALQRGLPQQHVTQALLQHAIKLGQHPELALRNATRTVAKALMELGAKPHQAVAIALGAAAKAIGVTLAVVRGLSFALKLGRELAGHEHGIER